MPTSRMGGHFVQGHVDSTGEIVAFWLKGDSLWVTVHAAEDPTPARAQGRKGIGRLGRKGREGLRRERGIGGNWGSKRKGDRGDLGE